MSNSGFVRIDDRQQDPLSQNAGFVDDDDDNLSLQSQDLDNPTSAGINSTRQAASLSLQQKSANIQAAMGNVVNRVQDTIPQNFAEQRKKLFNLDEFKAANRKVMIRAAAAEFLVTLIFIFVVCAVGINVTRAGHADQEGTVVGGLATAFCAIALIYSFADVSGANFNPAVTFATIVTGKTTLAKGLVYIGMQLSASLIAMLLLTIVFPPSVAADGTVTSVVSSLVVSPAADTNLARALVMEIILSFILVYVIFATAFDTVNSDHTDVKLIDARGNEIKDPQAAKKNAKMTIYTTTGSSKAGFAPLSIGLTLGFLCFLGGSVSGGAFNPARAFGPALCSWNGNYLWLYWLGDFTGAGLAGLVQQKFFSIANQKK
ncbi:hypothetical protein MP228_006704 [Amoeboaphelidium protococcarum]|nr:hypothetical protein MP228_006704 [Amoeboaphelidium protococcarum]